MARRILWLGATVALGATASAVAACGSGQQEPCPTESLRCADDGRLYCRFIPPTRLALHPACCLWPEPDAGEGADGGPATDGGSSQPEEPQMSCGDAGFPMPDGGLPQGRDKAGVKHLWRCGVDVCHPGLTAFPVDAGACTNPFGCGPGGP